MKPSQALKIHRHDIEQVVARHHALNPRVFGSVARDADNEASDLDLLVETTPDTSLLDIALIEVELETLLGIPVDVVTPDGLAESFRGGVLSEARAL